MLAASFLLLMQSQADAQNPGPVMQGHSTRYWDCCKPSCAWSGKAKVNRPVKTCAKNGIDEVGFGASSGCNQGGGDGYMCLNQQPWNVDSQFSYGFVAAKSLNGLGESDTCCACYLLKFSNGKQMLAQVTNTGDDLNNPNQMDIAMPGGGVGKFNACSNQWGAPPQGWGAEYGGLSSRDQCYTIPSQLQPGCLWRFDWFQADNPTMSIQRYRCPAQLTDRTLCVRDDDAQYPYYNSGPNPGPVPGGDIKWQTGADGFWALGCDFNGQDLRSAKSTGDQCSTVCKGTSGCTHYAWTPFNGGTCWMKQGAAAQTGAIKSSVSGIVCGINSAGSGGGGGGISWNGNWAFGCDFKGQDLTSAQISGSNCGSRCATTRGCTHFTWTTFNGGTCWMKNGAASKSDAFATSDKTMVCGVL